LNVYKVLTAKDITGTQRLKKYTVPSLREIWEEEKARMDVQQEDYPEDDFLRNQMISSKKNLKLR
jgi:hypothetical protein